MSDAIHSVLSQIRSLREQIATPAQTAPAGVAGAAPAASFRDTLSHALGSVNRAQQDAARLKNAWEFGEPGVDLVRVMVAAQEAQIGFRATVEVRNRLVQAYQDIMNMPV